jgi:hypothetical protein
MESVAACLWARLLSPLFAPRQRSSWAPVSQVRPKPPSSANNFRRPIRNFGGVAKDKRLGLEGLLGAARMLAGPTTTYQRRLQCVSQILKN